MYDDARSPSSVDLSVVKCKNIRQSHRKRNEFIFKNSLSKRKLLKVQAVYWTAHRNCCRRDDLTMSIIHAFEHSISNSIDRKNWWIRFNSLFCSGIFVSIFRFVVAMTKFIHFESIRIKDSTENNCIPHIYNCSLNNDRILAASK